MRNTCRAVWKTNFDLLALCLLGCRSMPFVTSLKSRGKKLLDAIKAAAAKRG
jgi:hypothetical protein